MPDSFEEISNIKSQEVKECQNSKNLETCNDCEKLLDCNTRDEYVKAIYNNMNKGKVGGFEF